MAQEKIIIRGARQHNLKNIDIEIPRDKLVVLTGLSGSGKSSLAFDTIYAEGQRRYVESLSAYARQFLGQMDKPDVDYIGGLSPAISIDQKTTSRNPRSTVGTVTEIHDYLRLLYARIGHPHCPQCGRPVSQQTVDQIVDTLLALPEGTKLQLLAPLVRGRKGEYVKLLAGVKAQGYVRVRIDGHIYSLDELPSLNKQEKHDIEVVVDRLILREGVGSRLADSLETALQLAEGRVHVLLGNGGTGEILPFNSSLACPQCGISLEEMTPRMFSFNNPHGACPVCSGLGKTMKVDEALLLRDDNLSISDGALRNWTANTQGWYFRYIEAVCRKHNISLDVPFKQLPRWAQEYIFYGTGNEVYTLRYEDSHHRPQVHTVSWEGIVNNLQRRYKETNSPAIREEIEKFMSDQSCPACKGERLRPESLAVTVGGKNIAAVSRLTVRELRNFFDALQLTDLEATIAGRVLKEIKERLDFLINVGLDYLTLARSAGSLSGGEAQRIRLATQIGSHLTGVLYVLDEPSIGLHQRDNARLIDTLKQLRDLGNTVLVVEHDEETMRAADYIIDIGPGAGRLGGELVACGTIDEIAACERSVTGNYLSGRCQIEVPPVRRRPLDSRLVVKGAKENNLKDITVEFPLGVFICVTGVSGSGKSTLVNDILHKALAHKLHGARELPGKYDSLAGLHYLDKVVEIDQNPIGRTPRSNPATYTGVFGLIRELFAQTPESRARGYKPGRFSFNVAGGRCEACQGDGIIKIEMHFLPDVYVPCEACKGQRYNRETLDIYYKGKNIADVLAMTVDEAADFFARQPRIYHKLQVLQDVGLGYIQLGQAATTLSGGEAQRVKLATELSRRATGRSLYILDEPTTGLHVDDIKKLLSVLNRLVDAGNTVIVIEHNLDVIKCADYIIDLGPEGGDLGGRIVAQGTPEELAGVAESYTGQFIKPVLAQAHKRQVPLAGSNGVAIKSPHPKPEPDKNLDDDKVPAKKASRRQASGSAPAKKSGKTDKTRAGRLKIGLAKVDRAAGGIK